MTAEEFNLLVHNRTEKIKDILAKKAQEYARDDRLSNFKRAAVIQRETPEKAWLGMWAKHLVSILDMVEDVDRTAGVICWNTALWDEKITDAVNYLILLEALVMERLRSKDETAQALAEAVTRVERTTARRRKR